MDANQPSKVLRIGVIQAGKIIEERLIRDRRAVSVGSDLDNTVVLTADGVPKRFKLLEPKGADWQLAFTAEMTGRVLVDEAAADLDSFKDQGVTQVRGARHLLKLNPASKGRVSLGEVVVLFQFVNPPPEPVRPVLPRALRGTWHKNLDWAFSSVLAVVFCAFFTVVAVAKQAPLPPEPTLDDLPVRVVEVFMPDRFKDMPNPDDEGPGEKKPEPKKKKKKPVDNKQPEGADDLTDGPEAKAAVAARKRDAMEAKVTRRGLVGILGQKGPGGVAMGPAVSDVFREGSITGARGTAFENMNGLDLAMHGSDLSPRGPGDPGPGGPPVEYQDLGTEGVLNGTGDKRRVKREAVVTAKLTPAAIEDFESDGRDRGQIKKVVKRRLGMIRRCYERKLKRDPNLRGKVVVRFVIHSGGRVIEVEVVENTTGDSDLAACVAGRVRSIRFGPADGGDTLVTYPFLLDAGGG
jgi:outer membrane biosynthesis protein TonB